MSKIEELIKRAMEKRKLIPPREEKIEVTPDPEVTPREEALIKRRKDGATRVTWQEYTVPNVSQYFVRNDEPPKTIIKCPEFSSGSGIEGDTWSWKIVFNHHQSIHWVEVLADSGENNLGIRAIIAIYVVDNKGEEIFMNHLPNRFFGDFESMTANFFPQKEEIDKEKFLPNNSLTLRLKLTILLDDKTPLPAMMVLKKGPKANLPSYYKNLYLNRNKTGNVIVKVKEEIFQMHKEVLKNRCPRLLDIFDMQVIDGKKIFEISDIDCKVLEKILEFLYLDELTDIDDCIVPLWKASHEYEIPELKRRCEIIINEDFLSVENAEIVCRLARKCNSNRLCSCIYFFLKVNLEQ